MIENFSTGSANEKHRGEVLYLGEEKAQCCLRGELEVLQNACFDYDLVVIGSAQRDRRVLSLGKGAQTRCLARPHRHDR
jgi:hypothetical protein